LSESGLTAKEFAREIGVNVHTLAGWKWRLTREAHWPAIEIPRFSGIVYRFFTRFRSPCAFRGSALCGQLNWLSM
jgi:hypothetical protein